jgi:hypothetical protein
MSVVVVEVMDGVSVVDRDVVVVVLESDVDVSVELRVVEAGVVVVVGIALD